jgi:hypothetical protein
LETILTYVDLNCVRAGIVRDPMNYRFCGYAEAVAGNVVAQEGLNQVIEGRDWTSVHAAYRERLFGVGGGPRENADSFHPDDVKRVIAAGGHVPLVAMLRCRIRYFTDGAVLGTRAFVEAQFGGRGRRTRPLPLPDWTDWPHLATLRAIRRPWIA